jgi:Mlc titration factor MtfA (ptsG expression regulator)
VLEGHASREGEAWYRGPVILSWADVLSGSRDGGDGHNLVLHEFAHQLDMQNGHVSDGVPPLHDRAMDERWSRVMRSEFQRLVDDCRVGRRTLLDCYGATSPSEFFAVASECFFERPERMSREHGDLYSVMREYYRQDPLTRSATPAS